MACKTALKTESSFGKELPEPCSPARTKEIVVMPDIYTHDHETKKPDPAIVDQSLPHIDKFVGFNPYDTGIMQKKLPDG